MRSSAYLHASPMMDRVARDMANILGGAHAVAASLPPMGPQPQAVTYPPDAKPKEEFVNAPLLNTGKGVLPRRVRSDAAKTALIARMVEQAPTKIAAAAAKRAAKAARYAARAAK